MIVFVRFPTGTGLDPWMVENAVQGAVGRSGVVIGASETAIDLEVSQPEEVENVLGAVAEALREIGLPPTTLLDVPATGNRRGIYDF